ncbi:MAG TPA: hypothetical protein DCY25_03660, partial [Bacteroidales bacterium]|nr:hypothetical protein [Bacteroidales bacterium]
FLIFLHHGFKFLLLIFFKYKPPLSQAVDRRLRGCIHRFYSDISFLSKLIQSHFKIKGIYFRLLLVPQHIVPVKIFCLDIWCFLVVLKNSFRQPYSIPLNILIKKLSCRLTAGVVNMHI